MSRLTRTSLLVAPLALLAVGCDGCGSSSADHDRRSGDGDGIGNGGATVEKQEPAPAQRHGGAIVRESGRDDALRRRRGSRRALDAAVAADEGHDGYATCGGEPAGPGASRSTSRCWSRRRDSRRARGVRSSGGRAEDGRPKCPFRSTRGGLAVNDDQKTAVVTSAWSSKVSGVDLQNLTVRWTVDVAREPRGGRGG